MIGIYKITCTSDNKIYIGQSIHLKKRMNNHKTALDRNDHSNSHLQNAWNKYGEKNFKFEIIELCSEEELDKRETTILEQYGYPDNKLVFNLESGGNKNKHLSEETKEKIRLKHIGTHHTLESRQKISQTSKGRQKSLETRKKMSLARLGTHPSPETLKKMSEVASGSKNGHYGIPRTEKEKQKMRENNPNTKIVQQFTRDGVLLNEFLGTHLASKHSGAGQAHIIQCCLGQRKSAGGYIWKYKERHS